MINMGITDYIKTRLLNNRVEQYNTKRRGNSPPDAADGRGI